MKSYFNCLFYKETRGCYPTIVKTLFAFLQEQRERFAIDSVIFAQDAFCLIPKIPNAVNVVLTVGKFLGVVDAVMDKTAHARLIIAAQAIRVNNAVRHDFLFDNSHQSIGLGIICDNGIDPSVAFQNAEDIYLLADKSISLFRNFFNNVLKFSAFVGVLWEFSGVQQFTLFGGSSPYTAISSGWRWAIPHLPPWPPTWSDANSKT